MTDFDDTSPAPARPWWKHPATIAGAIIVLAIIVVALIWWFALRDTGPGVAELEAEAPETVVVGESFEVTATVRDSAGEPVPEVGVSLTSDPALAEQPDEAVFTGNDGTATFTDLAAGRAGTHALTLSAGRETTELTVEATEAEGRIQLSAPSEVAPGEEFTAQVSFFRAGEPSEGEAVVVSVEPDGPVQRVETGADGSAEAVFADGVADAGEYTLRAASADGDTEATQPLEVTAQAPQPTEFQADTGRTTDPFEHTGGLARFTYDHQGQGSFSVEVQTTEGQSVATLVQDEGTASGSRYIGLDEGRYVLAVETEGSWTVQYSAPVHDSGQPLPVSYSGDGATAATPPLEHDGGTVTFEYSHDGSEGFTVRVLAADSGDTVATVADTSGQVDGTSKHELSEGVYVLDVVADGSWNVQAR